MNDKSAQTECVKRWAVFFDSLDLTCENNSRTFSLNEIDFTPDFYIKDWDAFVGINSNVITDEEAMQQYQLICSITGQRAIYICGFPSLNKYKATVFNRDEDSEMLKEDDKISTTYVLITEGEFRQCRRCPNIIFAGDIEDGESNLSFGLGHKNARQNCYACGDYEPMIGDAMEKAFQAAMAADLTNDNPPSIVAAGNYYVVVEGAHATRDRTTKTDDHPRGEPMIVWNLKIIGGEHDGRYLRRKQSINSATYKQVIADLQLCDVHCNAENLLANLPRVRGVELDIAVSGDATRTITFSRRLDNKSFTERGVSEQIERFPDVADEFGKVTGVPEKPGGQTTKPMNRAELQSATEKLADKLTEKANESSPTPIIQVFSSEEWDCHDSLLNELDPNFMVIDEEQ